MQLKFHFFKEIVIEYVISKKTRFCGIYEKTCYGPIAKMLFLNMLYNHGKLCASIIKCIVALSFYTNRLNYLTHRLTRKTTRKTMMMNRKILCEDNHSSVVTSAFVE